MSNQMGDCFKFLWPFQNVRTLTFMFLMQSEYLSVILECTKLCLYEYMEMSEVYLPQLFYLFQLVKC